MPRLSRGQFIPRASRRDCHQLRPERARHVERRAKGRDCAAHGPLALRKKKHACFDCRPRFRYDMSGASAIPRGEVHCRLAYGGKEYSLPPGEWQVLSTADGFSTMGGIDRKGVTYRVYLVQVDAERRLVGALQYKTSLTSAADITHWIDDPCRRTDTIYRDTLDGNAKFPACLMLNQHQQQFLAGRCSIRPVFGEKSGLGFMRTRSRSLTPRFDLTTPSTSAATICLPPHGSTPISQEYGRLPASAGAKPLASEADPK